MLKKRILALAVSLACAFSVMPMASLTAFAAADVSLGDLEAGAKQIAYVDFSKDLPNGVTVNDNVSIADGVASMSDGEVRFDRDTLLAPMQTHKTLIAEAVVKFNVLSNHRIVMSMGSSNATPHVVMGMHENHNIKCNDTKGPNDDLQTDVWMNLKYVVSDTGTKLYVDDELEAESDTDRTDISAIDGDFIFGHYTVQQWADAAFDGEVSEIRLSVADEETAIARLSGATLFGGSATVDEANKEVTVEMLKNTNISDIKFNADKGGTAVVSADGSKVTVTSADGKNTAEYTVTYTEVESLDKAVTNLVHNKGNRGTYDPDTKTFTPGDGDTYQYTTADINTAGELNWNGSYTNLNPKRSYVLTALMQFDFSEVDENADENLMVLGIGPCVYSNGTTNGSFETGWDNSGSWSAGIYNYYVNGGLYTYGQLKALQEKADENGGYVEVSTVINASTFKFDPEEMTGLGIQARLAGLNNISTMHNQFDPDTDLTVGAPDGIKAYFSGFRLTMLSNNTDITVTVDGVTPTLSGNTFTAKVASAATHNVSITAVDPTTTFNFDPATNKITVTAEDGTVRIYNLVIDDGSNNNNNNNGNNNNANVPANGTKVVNGKTVLYKNSKAVTGTKVVTVGKKTYAVVKGYVKTGSKTQLVKIGKKTYVVNKNGVVVKAKANKLIKIGSKSYVLSKNGTIVKAAKNKLVKVGKKSYIVNKSGVVQKNKKSIKVGKKVYKTNKKGVATKKK